MTGHRKQDRRQCVHFDTNVWLSLLVKEEDTSERTARYLSRVIFSRHTRAGMSVVVLGEIIFKLIEFYRGDPETLSSALDFIERFLSREAWPYITLARRISGPAVR